MISNTPSLLQADLDMLAHSLWNIPAQLSMVFFLSVHRNSECISTIKVDEQKQEAETEEQLCLSSPDRQTLSLCSLLLSQLQHT